MNILKFNNRIAFVLAILCVFPVCVFGQSHSPELYYSFSNISSDGTMVIDDANNGYNASLKNGASVCQLGEFNILKLGDANGYLDMGEETGSLIASLDNYAIAVYLYVDESSTLSAAGNFVWAFGNSNNMAYYKNGGFFFSANSQKYAISLTHWAGEQVVNIGDIFPSGKWKHIVYNQDGNTGSLYIDGEFILSEEVTIKPKDLGTTLYNYLGRSLYSSDVYLKNASLFDFKIYTDALSDEEISLLASNTVALNNAQIELSLKAASANLIMDGLDYVISDLNLPLHSGNAISITWESSDPSIISDDGSVVRPAIGEDNTTVVLTAVFSQGDISYSKSYGATVIALLSNETSVEHDAADLKIEGNINNLRNDLVLPQIGNEGSTITWSSDLESFLTSSGHLVKLSPNGSGKRLVTLSAIISKGNVSEIRTFDIYIAEDEGCEAYLFVYFTGNVGDQEAIRFALSDDGYSYTSLNGNNPVISSQLISSTGGVRDPHILRGNDGWFYMTATDMVSANGWSSNRAMVLLKSKDLINWESSVVNIQNRFPGQEDLLRVWAPQTIYDSKVGKYMIYWSMKYGDNPDIIYYAYANSDFTDLESVPAQLFYHPSNSSCIDGDIIEKDGKFHLFFKTEGTGNGIKKAVSDNLTEGYVLYDQYLQQTDMAVEGSSVFRLINSDTYILMYDVYMAGQYQFTESEDLLDFSICDQDVSMDFQPRHGSIIPITAEEKERLIQKWGTPSGFDQQRILNPASLDFSLFPNPAKDVLNVLNASGIKASVTANIYSSTGDFLMRYDLNNALTSINVSHLDPGLYLIVYTNLNLTVGRHVFIIQ
ncbi:immunoglobulin-like domain-containing protein [Geofilum sp. OHC36d9]|uniref:immunoglobulin-like domain-containing protein n=1 Tax=Geofilum sp. OHC36d9 TaxID=3458413 RepID=UPI004033A5EF